MDSLVNQCGYDDSLLLTDAPEYLRCTVCTLVLRDPVQDLSCGHKYCNACFQRLKDRALNEGTELLCPVDRKVVDMACIHRDVAMKRAVGNLKVKCIEHENGCTWTGDLSDFDTHLHKCELRKPEVSLTESTLKKLNERLEMCEASLFAKDKEVASLKYKIQQQEKKLHELERQQNEQQRQHQEDIELLRFNIKQQQQQQQEQYQQQQDQLQQLQDEVTCWKEKNDVLEEEVKQQKCHISELNAKIETWRGDMTGKGACAAPVDTHSSNANSSKNKKVVSKKVPVKRHRGIRGSVTVSEDFDRVVFVNFSTVSAPTAAVPGGARVWYEVYIHPGDRDRYQQIGWSTANLPTSDEHTGIGVGDTKDSYGFDPIDGDKYHGGHTKWGKTLTWEEGGYVGVGLDTIKGHVLFSVNGDWTTPMGVAFTGVDTNTPLFPALSGNYLTMEINFGDRDFKYGPPSSNFKKLIDTLS